MFILFGITFFMRDVIENQKKIMTTTPFKVLFDKGLIFKIYSNYHTKVCGFLEITEIKVNKDKSPKHLKIKFFSRYNE